MNRSGDVQFIPHRLEIHELDIDILVRQDCQHVVICEIDHRRSDLGAAPFCLNPVCGQLHE
jgi:hypothetical protein